MVALLMASQRMEQRASDQQITLMVLGGHVHALPQHAGAGSIGSVGGISGINGGVFPHPSLAFYDKAGEGHRCLVGYKDTQPRWCTYGDPEGALDVAVLGDSKMEQYHDALDVVGQALGWKFRMATKSACPFTTATVQWNAKPYTACSEFNQAVWMDLEENPPDLVISSQNGKKGWLEKGGEGASISASSREGMVQGLVQTWTKLGNMGAEVLVVLDNPRPPKELWPVYECMLNHASDYDAVCAFDKQAGQATSAERVQRSAAERVRKLGGAVNLIDLADYICPEETRCSPAVGGITVYRAKSHLTNTYAKSLAPILEKKLREATSTNNIRAERRRE